MDKFDLMMRRTGAVTPAKDRAKTDRSGGVEGRESFARILEEAVSQPSRLKLSAHAVERMHLRGLELGHDEMEKVAQAVDKLGEKGGRQALVLTENKALVVSVENKTVITAVDRSEEAGRVFTNIDSAVVLD